MEEIHPMDLVKGILAYLPKKEFTNDMSIINGAFEKLKYKKKYSLLKSIMYNDFDQAMAGLNLCNFFDTVIVGSGKYTILIPQNKIKKFVKKYFDEQQLNQLEKLASEFYKMVKV